MSNCYQRNRVKLLNQSKEYYENNKDRIRVPASNIYRELSDKKRILKENMEEIDIKICLKKVNRD